MKKNILITGAAGFIGFHLTKKLSEKGLKIVGVDNLNTYYDKNLKLARLKQLKKFKNFIFLKSDISDIKKLKKFLKNTILVKFIISQPKLA